MVMVLTKICMPPQRHLRALVPTQLIGSEPVGSRVARSAGVGQVAPAKLFPGLWGAASARILPRESTSPSCPHVLLVLALPWLSRASASLRLPSFALLSVAVARSSDCPCTSKRVKRRSPTFVHRQPATSATAWQLFQPHAFTSKNKPYRD